MAALIGLARRRSSKRCTTTKKEGTNNTARQVEAIIPLKTDIPSDCLAFAPAPVAVTSGSTPRIKANEVIRIGRNLVRAASTAGSAMGVPSARQGRFYQQRQSR